MAIAGLSGNGVAPTRRRHALTHPETPLPSGQSRIYRLLEDAGIPDDPRQAAQTLIIEHLGKRYGETVALTGANVDFTPGIHTILGENGSGKSTMLKILSGVVTPTEGRVILNGSDIAPRSPAEMQRLGLSTVFQEVLIAPHRSVLENIFMGTDAMTRCRIDKRVRSAAARAALATLAKEPIDIHTAAGDLPLAAQQIVVLARAFVRRPSILLLDEATAALDISDRDMVFDIIEDYAACGNIVIFISHRLEEVKRLSDQVTVLRSGQVIETLPRQKINSQLLLELMAPEAHIHVQ